MKKRIRTLAWAAVFVATCMTAPAWGEVTVTISITGSIDEILPILQLLRDVGIGVDVPGAKEDAIKLRVHSIAGPEAQEMEATAPPPVVLPEPPVMPEPDLAMGEPVVIPVPAKAGGTIAVTAKVWDKARKVDTVAAVLTARRPDGAIMQRIEPDLYDNGSRGDKKARDGLWSREITLPPDAMPGTWAVEVIAFDANGLPVQIESKDGKKTPLMAKGTFAVK